MKINGQCLLTCRERWKNCKSSETQMMLVEQWWWHDKCELCCVDVDIYPTLFFALQQFPSLWWHWKGLKIEVNVCSHYATQLENSTTILWDKHELLFGWIINHSQQIMFGRQRRMEAFSWGFMASLCFKFYDFFRLSKSVRYIHTHTQFAMRW